MQKYSVNQYVVGNILNWVQSGEIAIPEIQRPFVWSSSKVRDLMDSLYKGYPIGYVIAWKNPDVRTKDGSLSAGRKILIDGQQRITALRAAVLGEKIVDKEYKEVRITISFNPLTEEFKTKTPAIAKDKTWVSDISSVVNIEAGLLRSVNEYLEKNPEADREKVEHSFTKLMEIKNKPVGFIDLDASLDIDTVTEVFIRINSKGVVLSQADFAMSKIASYGEFGVNLRKLIDYFCHLSREPQFYKHISENDREFSDLPYLHKIEWLKNENDDLYDPTYTDVIRVAFTKEFKRGKLPDLVSLLSGRNFVTRTFESEIAENSFRKLEKGILEFVNEYNFKQFIMIIKSTGFIKSSLITSRSAINFAYALYLKLREENFDSTRLNRVIQRWFVMSMLTSRYTSSSETKIDEDIRAIDTNGVEVVLEAIERAELSDVFWDVGLVQELEKAGTSNPMLNMYFVAQIKNKDRGFLSSDILVENMIQHRGDIHHLFPYDYLKKQGYSLSQTNQIANFVYAETGINIRIGNNPPRVYFAEILEQVRGGKSKYGGITTEEQLKDNLDINCIPELIYNAEATDYMVFLSERRKLMSKKIKQYYKSL